MRGEEKNSCSNTIIGEFIRRRGGTEAGGAARDNFLTERAPWCSDRNTDNTREILFLGRLAVLSSPRLFRTLDRIKKRESWKSLRGWDRIRCIVVNSIKIKNSFEKNSTLLRQILKGYVDNKKFSLVKNNTISKNNSEKFPPICSSSRVSSIYSINAEF